MLTQEEVILVNEDDEEIGVSEKHQAHLDGKLHRAISVFIVNAEGELLLQKRALNKYHSGGLWTNTCCSHPRPNEPVDRAAIRRLKEEMGIENCELKFLFTFNYKATLDNDFIEHEVDHVFIGYSDQLPQPDEQEVCDWSYVSMSEISKNLELQPENYTHWFRLIFEKVRAIYVLSK